MFSILDKEEKIDETEAYGNNFKTRSSYTSNPCKLDYYLNV